MELQRIGRYEIQGRLGTGGMGSVYLARDPSLERLVAIKLLKDDFADDPDLRERFLREARSVARLRHRNIVVIFDIGEHDGRPFMAMEYVSGDTLSKVIRRSPEPPLIDRLVYAEDLCAGLAHAHAAGIIHRDVKPSNMMLDGEGTVKILDFGIARQANSSMTSTGMLMGSLNYMSPEQAVGGDIGPRTDIFAAGAVLYELICQQLAFPGGMDSGVLNRIMTAEHVPIDTRLPNIDPELSAIVERALARDPADRYASIELMRADLVRVRGRMASNTRAALDGAPDRTVAAPRSGVTGDQVSRGSRSDSERRRKLDPARLSELRRQQVGEYVRLAEAAFDAGDYAAALEQAERAAVVDHENRQVFDLIDRAKGRLEAAATQERLARVRAELGAGNLESAHVLIGEAAAAIAQVDDAGLHAEVRGLAAEVDAARERVRRIGAALDRARESFDTGGYETALRAVYEVLALDPDSADAHDLEHRAKSRLREQREQRRQRLDEHLQEAAGMAAAGRFDEARALLGSMEAPESDTARRRAEQAHAEIDRLERVMAARDAVARARRALLQGDLHGAGALLETVPDDLRASEAGTLETELAHAYERERDWQRINQEIPRVEQLLASGALDDAQQRLQTLVDLGVADERLDALRREATRRIVERREAELSERATQQAVDQARRLFAAGDINGAVARLRQADPSHPAVDAASREFRDAIAERERARQEEERRERERLEAERREAAGREAEEREAQRRRADQEAARARREAEQRERERSEAARASAQREAAERAQREALESQMTVARQLLRDGDPVAARATVEATLLLDASNDAALALRDSIAREETRIVPPVVDSRGKGRDERGTAAEVTAKEQPRRSSPPPATRRRWPVMIAGAAVLGAVGIAALLLMRQAPAPPPPDQGTRTDVGPKPDTGTPPTTQDTVAGPPPPAQPGALVTGTVKVDALPWANVIVKPLSGDIVLRETRYVTPFSVELPEGEYELRFDNPGYGAPDPVKVRVRRQQPSSIQVTMRGFSPERAADAILAPP